MLQKGYTVDFLTKERKRNNGEVRCAAPHIKESTLEACFSEAVNRLFTDKGVLIEEYRAIIDDLITHAAAIETEHKSLTEECEVVTEMIRKCVEENAAVALNQDEYRERYTALAARYEKTAQRRDELAEALNGSAAQRESINHFLTEVLGRDGGIMSRFDVELWCAAVENATIETGGVRVHFKNGTAVAVSIR